MNPEVARSAAVVAVSIVGLVVFLTAAEVLDVKWLVWPGIACLALALAAGEYGWLGRRALAITVAIVVLIIAAGFVSAKL